MKIIYCILLLTILLLVGCVPRIIQVNNTVYTNRTIYINDTITIYNTTACQVCNTTINITAKNDTTLGASKLELIRRIQWLESQQTKYFNNSFCDDELNTTEVKLSKATEELCNEWNSSWC